jgi:hypothetical protein
LVKVISPRSHAPIDYLTVVLVALAPTIFNLDGTPETLSYVLAMAYLGVSLLTRYPGGVMPMIPFPVHGMIELVTGIALIILPFVAGWQGNARIFFVALGLFSTVVWALTDWRADVATRQARSAHAAGHTS